MAGYILNYREKKAKAREEAVRWQTEFANHNYSYGELTYFSDYFETKARRYGLVKEFREEGII